MYIKKILLVIVLVGLAIGCYFTYTIYNTIFRPNTKFNNAKVYIFIGSNDGFEDVKLILKPLLDDMATFEDVANKKGYSKNIKGGKYVVEKGMNNNEITNSLRSNNIPIKITFNNQERIYDLAATIAKNIEADSLSLLKAFKDVSFLEANGFDSITSLAMYVPNSYKFFWNTSAKQFRSRMLKEYKRFWNDSRLKKAEAIGLTPNEVVSLAAIVNKETIKVKERPRVAGVYLNRLKRGMLLQADPTVIYALKLQEADFNKVIKRVLYKDLKLDSPYNTYKYTGVPPGPIFMPNISAIDAVLNPEKHEYYYFVADVENFGYHKFAKTLAQHNKNKRQYVQWIRKQNIRRR